jgi:hypothetical protein
MLLTVGFSLLSLLLFTRSGADSGFIRPRAQMVIATGVTLITHAIPVALFLYIGHTAFESAANAARLSIPAPEAERWGEISSIAALIITFWALALPTFAWWRWSGAREASGRLTRA